MSVIEEVNKTLKGKVTLVDAGASGGLSSRWQPYKKSLEVHCFDPEPGEYAGLAKVNSDFDRKIHQVALGTEDCRKVLNVTQAGNGSSFLTPNFDVIYRYPRPERMSVVKQLEVPVARLDTLVNQVDFLKLDVQGTELDVLKGAGKLLDSALFIETEVSFQEFYKDQPLFHDVQNFMTLNGFKLIDLQLYHFRGAEAKNVRGCKGELIFGVGLYMKNLDAIDSFANRFSEFSLICDVYGLYDQIVEAGSYLKLKSNPIVREAAKGTKISRLVPSSVYKLARVLAELVDGLLTSGERWHHQSTALGNAPRMRKLRFLR